MILLSFNISCKDAGNVSRGRTPLCTKQSECCFRYQDKLWLYYREAPKNHWTADELLEKIEIDIEEKLEK